MNVCIATSNYFPDTGGISTYSQRLARLLQMEGHSAYVLTIDINATIDQKDSIKKDKYGVTVIHLKKSFHLHYKYFQQYFRPGGLNAPYWLAIGKAMKEWLLLNYKHLKLDIIEASAYGGFAAFLQDPELPPVLISGHGAFFQYKEYNQHKEDEQSKLVEKLEKLALVHADGIISHSPQSRNDILHFTSQPVYLATIPIILESISNKIIFSPKRSFALVVGNLQRLKGPEILCRALADERIKKTDLSVIWAGTDNYNHKKEQLMSETLEAECPDIWNKKLIWENTPDYNRLYQLYKEASFIIIPTIWESYNVISIEAAFHSKPVIITNQTGSSFLFTHKKDALIIPANDEKVLADAIIQLWSSPELCSTLGQAAYENIALTFTPERIISERIKIYNDCISHRKNNPTATELSFISNYTTLKRKSYFSLRKFFKKIFNNQ